MAEVGHILAQWLAGLGALCLGLAALVFGCLASALVLTTLRMWGSYIAAWGAAAAVLLGATWGIWSLGAEVLK